MPENSFMQLLCVIGFCALLVFAGECLDFVPTSWARKGWLIPHLRV
jgi:hypothetical protein